MTDGVTTAISHYSFGGLRIAVKRGQHALPLARRPPRQHVADNGKGRPYDRQPRLLRLRRRARRDGRSPDRPGRLPGQKRDATGLMYYNARYYDPALGTFISPDSMVPERLDR